MATRDNLIKVRRMIAEFKVYISRTQTYLAPVQLFMIFIIFLNTTVWNVEWIQGVFGSKVNFIVVGSVFFIIGVLVLGYVDTRLKMFRVEQGRAYSAERNPYTALFVLWTVLLLNDKKKSKNLEKKVILMLRELGAEQMYEDFKREKELR